MNMIRRSKTIVPVVAVIAISIVLSISAINAVEAQDDFSMQAEETMRTIFTIVFGPDFPESWVSWKWFLQLILLPFAAMLAVFYGLMDEIRIFKTSGGKKAQIVIAVVMALVAGKTVLSMMRGFLMANAMLGVLAFFSLMVIGIIMWGIAESIGRI